MASARASAPTGPTTVARAQMVAAVARRDARAPCPWPLCARTASASGGWPCSSSRASAAKTAAPSTKWRCHRSTGCTGTCTSLQTRRVDFFSFLFFLPLITILHGRFLRTTGSLLIGFHLSWLTVQTWGRLGAGCPMTERLAVQILLHPGQSFMSLSKTLNPHWRVDEGAGRCSSGFTVWMNKWFQSTLEALTSTEWIWSTNLIIIVTEAVNSTAALEQTEELKEEFYFLALHLRLSYYWREQIKQHFVLHKALKL